MKTAKSILSLTEDVSVQDIVDIFSDAGSRFATKFKSIGGVIHDDGKTSIQNIKIPSTLNNRATINLFISDLTDNNDIRQINTVSKTIASSLSSFDKIELHKATNKHPTAYISARILPTSPLREKYYQFFSNKGVLLVAISSTKSKLNTITINVYPSCVFLFFDIVKLWKLGYLNDAMELAQSFSEDILTLSNLLIKRIRFL